MVIYQLGGWPGNVELSPLSLENLDPSLLMWDMRRSLATRIV